MGAAANQNNNKVITIPGTDSCDTLGVEGIAILDIPKATIEFKP
jgi:hypothetical protein